VIVTWVDVRYADEPQRVRRKIAVSVELYHEKVVALGIWVDDGINIHDLNIFYALAAVQTKILFDPGLALLQLWRKFAEEIGVQGRLVIEHFDVVQTIESVLPADLVATIILFATKAHATSPVKPDG